MADNPIAGQHKAGAANAGRLPVQITTEMVSALLETPGSAARATAVREMRLVPVPTIPETCTWNPQDRATAARVLSYQLAEMLSTYGSAVTLEALALAFKADMQPAADAIRAPRLSATYDATATMVRGLATELERREASRQ